MQGIDIRNMFVIENVLMIVSCFLVGTFSGFILAFIVAKLNYFSFEIPFKLFMPYQVIIPLIILTLLMGILTTHKAFEPLLKTSIAELNRF